MNETEFWAMVDDVAWHEHCHKSRAEQREVLLRLAYKYPEDTMQNFSVMLGTKAIALFNRIKQSGIVLAAEADNLVDHAVAMGQEFYEDVLANPVKLQDVIPPGVFASIIPRTCVHYPMLEPGYFPERVVTFRERVLSKVDNSIESGYWDVILSVVDLLEKNLLHELPKPEVFAWAWYNYKKQTGQEDTLKHGDYFTDVVVKASIIARIRGMKNDPS